MTAVRALRRANAAARRPAPLDWVHYEPGSQSDLTQTSTTFAAVSGLPTLSFVVPASGTVVLLTNATWLTPTGMGGTQHLRIRWHDGTAAVTDTDRSVLNASLNRYRTDQRAIVTGLTPGSSQTWTLQIRSDGTHDAGLRVGPEHPFMALVWDPGNSILPNRAGYLIDQTNGTGALNPITSTTYVRIEMESNNRIDLPPFIVPRPGTVMVAMHSTHASCVDPADDWFVGLWDIDTDTYVTGSGCHMIGQSSTRAHCHYRQIVTGLPAGAVCNWSYATRVSSGVNNIGPKFTPDQAEGPMHMIVTGLDV